MKLKEKPVKIKKTHLVLCAALALAWTVSIVSPAICQPIITDGKTSTILNTVGNTTNITTTTITNSNAFNSFSRFNVDQGKTVNLIVPDTANNLINIVSGEKSNINGVLNSVKNGQTGAGNVFFANPYGIVVGSQGSINVGSLTLTTPTNSFVNNFFSSPENPNPASVNAILNNTEPISTDASITNNGTINFNSSGTFTSKTITNSGSIIKPGQGPGIFSLTLIADIVNLDNNSSIVNNSMGGYVNINRLTDGNIEIVSNKNACSSALQLTPDELNRIDSNKTIGNTSSTLTPTKDINIKTDLTTTGMLQLFAQNNLNVFGNIYVNDREGIYGSTWLRMAAEKRLYVSPYKSLNSSYMEIGDNNVFIDHDVNITSRNDAFFIHNLSGGDTKGKIVIAYRTKINSDFTVIGGQDVYIGANTNITSPGVFIDSGSSGNIILGNNAIINGVRDLIAGNVVYLNQSATLTSLNDEITLSGKNGVFIQPYVTINAGKDINLTSNKIIAINPFASLTAQNDIVLTSSIFDISPKASLEAGNQIIYNKK